MNYREYLEGAETTIPAETKEDREEVGRFIATLPEKDSLTRGSINAVLSGVAEDARYRGRLYLTEWMRFQIVRKLIDIHGKGFFQELA